MLRIMLKSRYTLLIAVLLSYLLALVAEGTLTGRSPRLEIENSFFDLIIPDLDQLTNDDNDQ
ncbi:MAG: hypothetical protein ACR2PR_02100 [Pseudohongiellaceae bacterium]